MNSIYYNKTARWLHWIMAIIFIAVWCIGFIAVQGFEKGEYIRSAGIRLHKNIASIIIFIAIIRIFWRFTHPAPKLPDTMPNYVKISARIGHVILYFILLILPISGLLLSWSAGKKVPVLYLFELPNLIQKNDQLKSIALPLHIYASWIAGIIVMGHILMALKHHFIDKDAILRRMLGPKNNSML